MYGFERHGTAQVNNVELVGLLVSHEKLTADVTENVPGAVHMFEDVDESDGELEALDLMHLQVMIWIVLGQLLRVSEFSCLCVV